MEPKYLILVIIVLLLISISLFCLFNKSTIENLEIVSNTNINLVYTENNTPFYLSLLPASYCNVPGCTYSPLLRLDKKYSTLQIVDDNIFSPLFNIFITYVDPVCANDDERRFVIEDSNNDLYHIVYNQSILSSAEILTFKKLYLSKCNTSTCNFEGENILLCASENVNDALEFSVAS